MKVSRRDFLKISAGAGAAATLMNKDVLDKAMAVILQTDTTNINLVWLHGQNCTGCSISILQWVGNVPTDVLDSNTTVDSGATYTTNLLTVLGATNTDLEFHPTLMPQAGVYYSDDGEDYEPYTGDIYGDPADRTYVDAMQHLVDVLTDSSATNFVIVEGAIPYEKWGDNKEQGFCEVGMDPFPEDAAAYTEGHMWNFGDIVKFAANQNMEAFIAYGNCGAFGGIPGGNPNPTGAKGLQHFLEDEFGVGWGTNYPPVININDCPAHPEYLVFTYAAILLANQKSGGWTANYTDHIELDQWNRPKRVSLSDSGFSGGDPGIILFGKQVHDDCERIAAFDTGDFATSFTEAITNPEKCLLRLGCRGVATHTNCSAKRGGTTGPADAGWNPDGVGIWNNDYSNDTGGTNPGSWCVAQGSPCYGCGTLTFPDNVFGSGFFRECTHSEMLATGKIPGDASGATPEYEGKGLVCYTCHAVSMPRENKEWIENKGTVGYGSGYGGSGAGY